jgi:hypothetical protein
MKEKARFSRTQVIIDDGCQVLERVAGVRKQKSVQVVAVALQDEFQAPVGHITGIRW